MHRKKTFPILIVCFCLILGNLFAQEQGKKLTMSRLFDPDQPSLSGKLPSRISWSEDRKYFFFLTTVEKTKEAIIWKYNVRKKKKEVYLNLNEIQKQWEKLTSKKEKFNVHNFIFSKDKKQMIFSYKGDLYYYNIKNRLFRRLTASSEGEKIPEFSPNGKYISYVRGNNLYVLEIPTGLEIQLTSDGSNNILNGYLTWVYYEELYHRNYKGYWWSPDSKYIVFYRFDESPVFKMTMVNLLPFKAQQIPVTYPKAGMTNPLVKIGIVSVKEQKTVWLKLNYNEEIYIARAIWTPDSKWLTVQILNRDQNRIDLLKVNPETGKSELILREEQKIWIHPKEIYFFKRKPYFLWLSDLDNWNHIYLYNLEGKLIKRLTQGSWSVRKIVQINEKKGIIYFIANKKSTLENHLYQVNLDGKLKRLTEKEGTYSIIMSPTCDFYLAFYNNISRPTRLDLYKADGTFVKAIEENIVKELSEYKLSKWNFLKVTTEDELELPAMMLKPQNFDPNKKYPVLFAIYGGPESQSVANRWMGKRGLWYQYLAQEGLIIFIMDNRGSAHFGKKYAHMLYGNLGHWEIHDYVQGVKYLSKLPYVDSNRIGIWGWSYGGYLTCMAMLTAPEYFQVGVSVAPVTHWLNYDTIYTERYMGQPKNNPKGYEKSATTKYAENLKGKLLIIHGTLDNNVHFQNTVQLVNKLISENKQFSVMIYPNRDHGIKGDNARRHIFTLITNFLLKNLK
ncbi:S9 family peptidase [Candidatus Aminicenantes bacterium AH-873-B07]|nr:S9 family peptidase [Candidatus Aminicenantes bacterium AH-873-B07]